MRYLVPLFLIAMLLTSAVLAYWNLFYTTVFIAQGLFYLAAGASVVTVRLGINTRWLALPQYFLITNVACLIALVKFLRGKRYASWEPIREGVANT
jgi:hypothetical protein